MFPNAVRIDALCYKVHIKTVGKHSTLSFQFTTQYTFHALLFLLFTRNSQELRHPGPSLCFIISETQQ